MRTVISPWRWATTGMATVPAPIATAVSWMARMFFYNYYIGWWRSIIIVTALIIHHRSSSGFTGRSKY
jgi:hypothetical protein